jgi:hypothetical protein
MPRTAKPVAIALSILFAASAALASPIDEPGGSGSAAAASAQEEARRRPRDFGVGNVNILQIPASAFSPVSSKIVYDFDALTGYRYATQNDSGVSPVFWAAVTLPTGSLVHFVDLYSSDTEPTYDLTATLYASSGYSQLTLSLDAIATVHSTGSPGYAYDASDEVSYTVDNDVRFGAGAQLTVVISVPKPADLSSLRFKAVDVWWSRQVSPAPQFATFGDVPPNHPFFQVIEALAKSGVTSGCGGNNFCPSAPMTRQEVAKFLVRALGLAWPDFAGGS